jgi:hypothetical protein
MGQSEQITEISNLGALIDAALQIAGKRRDTLQRLRTALLNSEDSEALKWARALCGLDNEEANYKAEHSAVTEGGSAHGPGRDGKSAAITE